ncbi:hypothetical protein CMESO_229 (nucleomorph) [Chroomonas mesostigmatica CCMP1168]|uniref:Uncharacterized protein n=1 Tax=Chroomonas mesostigmatica CCMP1168 TaxID=1195612 RepID=J7G1P1_9CRYP|nr:hypothetical protein CMESO_229 [Chroomonas mesostigmatica CCMP1168]
MINFLSFLIMFLKNSFESTYIRFFLKNFLIFTNKNRISLYCEEEEKFFSKFKIHSCKFQNFFISDFINIISHEMILSVIYLKKCSFATRAIEKILRMKEQKTVLWAETDIILSNFFSMFFILLFKLFFFYKKKKNTFLSNKNLSKISFYLQPNGSGRKNYAKFFYKTEKNTTSGFINFLSKKIFKGGLVVFLDSKKKKNLSVIENIGKHFFFFLKNFVFRGFKIKKNKDVSYRVDANHLILLNYKKKAPLCGLIIFLFYFQVKIPENNYFKSIPMFYDFLFIYLEKEGMILTNGVFCFNCLALFVSLEFVNDEKKYALFIKRVHKKTNLKNSYTIIIGLSCLKKRLMFSRNFPLKSLLFKKKTNTTIIFATKNFVFFSFLFFFLRTFWKKKLELIKKNFSRFFTKKKNFEIKLEQILKLKKKQKITTQNNLRLKFSKMYFKANLNIWMIMQLFGKFYLRKKKNKKKFLALLSKTSINFSYARFVEKVLIFLELANGIYLNFEIFFHVYKWKSSIKFFLLFFKKKTPSKIEKIFDNFFLNTRSFSSFEDLFGKYFYLGFVDLGRKFLQKYIFFSQGFLHFSVVQNWINMEKIIKNYRILYFIISFSFQKGKILKEELKFLFSELLKNDQWINLYSQLKFISLETNHFGSFLEFFAKKLSI